MAGLMLLTVQRGDDEARVGLARPRRCSGEPFGLGDDAALAAPAVACLPGEVLEAARRFAGLLAQLGSRGELGFDLTDQPGVARQAEQKVDAVGLAPAHQPVASKARIGTQQNAHLRPAGADLGDDPRHLLDAAVGL
jgi:hypothetical protein